MSSSSSSSNQLKHFIDASKELLGITKTTKHAKIGMIISGCGIQCDKLMKLICKTHNEIDILISDTHVNKRKNDESSVLSTFSETISFYNYVYSSFLYSKYFLVDNRDFRDFDYIKKSVNALETQIISALQSIDNIMKIVYDKNSPLSKEFLYKLRFVYNIIIKVGDGSDNTQAKYIKEIKRVVDSSSSINGLRNSSSPKNYNVVNCYMNDYICSSTDESDDSFLSSDGSDGNSSSSSQMNRFGRNQRNIMMSNIFDDCLNLVMDDDNDQHYYHKK